MDGENVQMLSKVTHADGAYFPVRIMACRFQREDPTFRVNVDGESGQTLIAGMGELHLDIYVERMRREYNVRTHCRRIFVAAAFVARCCRRAVCQLCRTRRCLQMLEFGKMRRHLYVLLFGLPQVDCEVGRPRVNYREAITKRADFDYMHRKQSGGQGQFGRVRLPPLLHIHFEPKVMWQCANFVSPSVHTIPRANPRRVQDHSLGLLVIG